MFLKTNRKVAVHIKDGKIFLCVVNYQDSLVKVECLQELPLDEEKLFQFVREKGIKRLPVYLAVGGNQIFSRVIFLPPVPEEEIKQALQWEVTKYLPLSPEEIIFDYEIINQIQIKDGKEIPLFIIAARRSYLENYCDLLAKVGLKPSVVDVEGSILRYFYLYSVKKPERNGSCFIYLDKERAVLSFLYKESLLFIYNVENKEIVNKVITEYMRVSRYLKGQFQIPGRQNIYLTGKVDDSTLNLFKDKLDVSVQRAQLPLEKFQFSSQLQNIDSSFLFTLGLLLREVG